LVWFDEHVPNLWFLHVLHLKPQVGSTTHHVLHLLLVLLLLLLLLQATCLLLRSTLIG
jgi:hypothetical protein